MTGIMCALAGGAADTAVSLADATVTSNASGSQTATFELRSDRSAWGVTTSLGASYIYDWLASYASPGNYEARVTVTGGSLSAGTTGTWLNLGTTRSWSATDAAPDGLAVETEILVEIRSAITTLVLDNAIVTLSAERT